MMIVVTYSLLTADPNANVRVDAIDVFKTQAECQKRVSEENNLVDGKREDGYGRWRDPGIYDNGLILHRPDSTSQYKYMCLNSNDSSVNNPARGLEIKIRR